MYFGLLLDKFKVGVAESEKRVAAIFLLPVLQIHFRFDHDDFLHAFFKLRSILQHFGPFRALL